MTSNADAHERNTQLDGLRGIAILWVIAYHYLACYGLHPFWSNIPGFPEFLLLGWAGVLLFFTLSGYLIISRLVATRESPDYYRSFFSKRSTRILPAYFALLATFPIAAALWDCGRGTRLFTSDIPFWTYLTLLQNFPMSTANHFGALWLGVTWSLAIEEQFYLFIVFFVRTVPRRWLVFALWGLAIFAVALRCWLFKQGASSGLLLFLTPCRMDCFAIGGLVALVGHSESASVRTRTLAGIGAIGGLLFVAYSNGIFGTFTRAILPAYYTFLSIAFAAAVGIAALRPRVTEFLSNRSLANLGRTSYFCYLFHMPIFYICFELIRHSWPTVSDWLGLCIALFAFFLCWVLANLSWRYFEQPMIRLGTNRL